MDIKSAILSKYNAKVFKSRKDHILEIEADQTQSIAANTRAIPGIMTNRGCCYAGCKGVVVGPLKDTCVITHGPIGCGFYTWGTRRNKAKSADGRNFIQYCFSTDMQEPDIVFGGDKKLKAAIDEAVEIFKPKHVMICSTCPVGLIGDDIHAVAAAAEKEHGITCLAFSCEGYKGVSQSGGHHIANNGLMKKIIGADDQSPIGQYSVNLLGEYNIGGDGWETERILKKIGYHVVSVFTGDGSVEDISKSHRADLNLVQCHRSINYVAEMMLQAYGTNWLKVNFVGLKATIESLRNLAEFFGASELKDRTEEVISEEMALIEEDIARYRQRLTGRKAALFVGGSRSHHYQELLSDLGVETVLAGYEFAHRDDYEGREIINQIKEDADSKNIESLVIEKDKRYRAILTPERYEELKKSIGLEQYSGLMRQMKDGAWVVDDLNHFETEEFVKLLKPDIFFSGIKDKFIIQKSGLLSRQLHSYDYSGPYSGFKGAVIFARDLVMGLEAPAWKLVTPPWKKKKELLDA
ncbi:MAG: nitrogenase molybdenum-iron protein alpha chain [Deltaproteobacteria bacterium]|jgi:nitrogenase molybdenum-iron protein alpha chain|nr:nitrogenase molybdenum-iron protein alpha chain [Deltaproteobacteria bacterium]